MKKKNAASFARSHSKKNISTGSSRTMKKAAVRKTITGIVIRNKRRIRVVARVASRFSRRWKTWNSTQCKNSTNSDWNATTINFIWNVLRRGTKSNQCVPFAWKKSTPKIWSSRSQNQTSAKDRSSSSQISLASPNLRANPLLWILIASRRGAMEAGSRAFVVFIWWSFYLAP